MSFTRGGLTKPISFGVEPIRNGTDAQMRTNGQSAPGQAISSVISVSPHGRFQAGTDGTGTISIAVSDSSSPNARIYRASPSTGLTYRALDTRMVNGRAEADISEGGYFVVTTPIATAFAVVAAVIVVLVIVSIAVIGVIVYFVVRRDKWNSAKDKMSTGVKSVTRSFAKKV